jgi:hypothetical protein
VGFHSEPKASSEPLLNKLFIRYVTPQIPVKYGKGTTAVASRLPPFHPAEDGRRNVRLRRGYDGTSLRARRVEAKKHKRALCALSLENRACRMIDVDPEPKGEIHPVEHTEELLIQKSGPICTLVINRPEKKNRLTPEALRKMADIIQALTQEDRVRALIIRGAGNEAFCAGYDITVLPVKPSSQDG